MRSTILANSISGVQSFSETSHEIGKETVLECSLVVTSGSDPSSKWIPNYPEFVKTY